MDHNPLNENPAAAYLTSTAIFRRGLEYAGSLRPEDVEEDPLMLAILLSGAIDGIRTLTARESDLLARIIGCLIIDWAVRIDGNGRDAVQVLLACQDAEKLVAKAMRKAANE